MAFGDYEHCPVCIAGQEKHGWTNPRTGRENTAFAWPGYKLLYMGDRETPEGMVVLCKEHAEELKPHIDGLIEQVKI